MSSLGREGCLELGIVVFLALVIGVSAFYTHLPLDFGLYSIGRHCYRQDPVAISFDSHQDPGSLHADHDYLDQSFSGLVPDQKVLAAKVLHPLGCYLALCLRGTFPVDDHGKDCLMNGREDNQEENLDWFLGNDVVPGNPVAVFFYDTHLVDHNCLFVNCRAFPYALLLSIQDHLARVHVPARAHHVVGLFLEVLALVRPIYLHLSLVLPSWILVHVVLVLVHPSLVHVHLSMVQVHPLMVLALP